MKTLTTFAAFFVIALISCRAPKSFFSVNIRNRVEAKSIPLEKLQFYVDRDIELRREVSSGDAKVTSGKVILENGKYINMILLKKNTPGVCTKTYDNAVDISFETGEGKSLSFGVPKGTTIDAIYGIFAKEWTANNSGKVLYDGKTYYIQPAGVAANLMIKKSVVDKMDVEVRTMKGLKVQ